MKKEVYINFKKKNKYFIVKSAVPAEAFSREEEVLEFRKLSAFSPEGDPSEALAGTAVVK